MARDARLAIEHGVAALRVPVVEAGRAEAGRARLTPARIGAPTRAVRLPLWALVSDTRAF